MKQVSVVASVLSFVIGASIATAQCPSCGSSGGAPGSGVPGGIGKGEPARKPAFEVVLKYFVKGVETKPAGLKAALEKIKGVQSVALPDDSRTAVISFSGKCEQIGSLETAAQNAGFPALVLNHAHVVVALRPLKGADLKGAAAELALVEGVHGVNPAPSGLELHANLEKLTWASLREAAAKGKCEITVNQTFEYVSYKVVEGGKWDFLTAADAVKGVMVVRDEGDAVGLWINKSMVKTEQLEKLDGFKLERQAGE
ncbi:MAG TPA: hypothetical protein VFC86_11770 [Planctomycetota bacterium]|nr:hypothetical protein [Planctomycetota bacterium]